MHAVEVYDWIARNKGRDIGAVWASLGARKREPALKREPDREKCIAQVRECMRRLRAERRGEDVSKFAPRVRAKKGTFNRNRYNREWLRAKRARERKT